MHLAFDYFCCTRLFRDGQRKRLKIICNIVNEHPLMQSHPLHLTLIIMGFKKFILSLVFVMACCLAKSNSIEVILNSKTKTIPRIELTQEENKLFLKTNFASPSIVNPGEIERIWDNVLLRIELVYTTYYQSESFKQRALNYQRLLSLKKIYPEIFENNLIEWSVIGQTECTTAEEGKNMFHGFVITFRPAPTEESMIKEMNFLKEAVGLKVSPVVAEKRSEFFGEIVEAIAIEEIPTFGGGDVTISSYIAKTLKYPDEALLKGIQGTVFVAFVVTETGDVTQIKVLKGIGGGCDEVAMSVVKNMPKWLPGKRKGLAVNSRFTLPIRFILDGSSSRSDLILYDHITPAVEGDLASDIYPITNYFVSDSTVIKTLDRNKDWKNMLVICDFTGSMSPYTSQLLVWHKLNLQTGSNGIKYFTFFNDGDSKRDGAKKIGATGGIYSVESGNFDDVVNLALKQ